MAGTIPMKWNAGLLRSFEEEGDPSKKENSSDTMTTDSPAHPHCKKQHLVIHESSTIHGPYKPSPVPEVFRRKALTVPAQAQNALLTHEKETNERETPQVESLVRNGEAAAFIALLRDCAKQKDLHRGTILHDAISKRGLLELCSDALVTMYAKCGALAKAQKLLYMKKSNSVSSWTSLIAGYAQQGQGHAALDCYEEMRCEGVAPDAVTFVCILKACGSIKALDKGEQIHDEAVRQGWLEINVMLGTALVDMYVKCGALVKAHQVLKELSSRDNFTWSALIAGYAQQGQGDQALICFEQMKDEGLSPTAVTYTCILKACGSIGAIDKGQELHDDIVQEGLLGNDTVLGNALVDMYVKCGALDKARQQLEYLPSRDVITWSTLIVGYANHGQGEQALKCYKQMQQEGLFPNAVTFVNISKACGIIGKLDKGEQIHCDITRHGLLGKNVVLGTAVVDMYAKCGALAKARGLLQELFSQDVSAWNALIAGYVEQGQCEQALDCFEQMQDKGCVPDAVTFVSILKACGSTGALEKGTWIHDEIVKQGLVRDNVVLGNALVGMYAKCGALAKARQVLKELPSRDVITWSAMIAGYAQQGQGEEALSCFEQMQSEGLSPNLLTFTCILKACGSIGAADKGEQFHNEISRQGLIGNDSLLDSALVDMYAKCGALSKAQQVLEELFSRDVNSWNALIAGYAQQGLCEQALNCFERMQCDGFFPDAGTFSCMLNACSHLGLIDDGHTYFVNMSTKYGVKPCLEHYTYMVDMFGRAGHLDKAVSMIQEMPSFHYSAVWTALLNACYKWGDVHVGRWAFEHAVQVEESDEAAFILMANIYAASGMQVDAKNVKAMRMKKEVQRIDMSGAEPR